MLLSFWAVYFRQGNWGQDNELGFFLHLKIFSLFFLYFFSAQRIYMEVQNVNLSGSRANAFS